MERRRLIGHGTGGERRGRRRAWAARAARRTGVLVGLLAAAAGLAPRRAAVAQAAIAPIPGRAHLVGVVRDSGGTPIPGATVRLTSDPRGAVSGPDGRFVLPGVLPGPTVGTVRRLGHLPVEFEVDLPRGARVEVAVTLVPSPTRLPTVVVDGERRDFLLYANGFYERRGRGQGVFLDPGFLEPRSAAPLKTVLREVPRLRQRCDPVGARCQMLIERPGAEACEPTVWLDGAPAPDGAVDEVVPVARVRGVEIYRDPLFAPGSFVTPGARCGAIVVWTDAAPGFSAFLPRRKLLLPPPADSAPATVPEERPAGPG